MPKNMIFQTRIPPDNPDRALIAGLVESVHALVSLIRWLMVIGAGLILRLLSV